MTTAYDARAAALHRNLDRQIENLERKNYHNRELITDLKKQKLKFISLDIMNSGTHKKIITTAQRIQALNQMKRDQKGHIRNMLVWMTSLMGIIITL